MPLRRLNYCNETLHPKASSLTFESFLCTSDSFKPYTQKNRYPKLTLKLPSLKHKPLTRSSWRLRCGTAFVGEAKA